MMIRDASDKIRREPTSHLALEESLYQVAPGGFGAQALQCLRQIVLLGHVHTSEHRHIRAVAQVVTAVLPQLYHVVEVGQRAQRHYIGSWNGMNLCVLWKLGEAVRVLTVGQDATHTGGGVEEVIEGRGMVLQSELSILGVSREIRLVTQQGGEDG